MTPLRFLVLPSSALSLHQRQQILEVCSDAYEEDFFSNLALLGRAVHLLAYADDTLVSHAAWVERELRTPSVPYPLRAAYIEAVATPVALQGKGFGVATMKAIPPYLTTFDIGALSPSEPGFYARLGWEMWRGELSYVHEGSWVQTPDDEDVMVLRLPRTPSSLDLDAPLQTDWRPGDVW
jgi:hypothetical protein